MYRVDSMEGTNTHDNTIESVKTTSMYMDNTRVLCKEIKYYLRHANRKNYNKVFWYCESLRYICQNVIKKHAKYFSIMSNLQTYYNFILDFQKSGRGKWFIHGTKQRKYN